MSEDAESLTPLQMLVRAECQRFLDLKEKEAAEKAAEKKREEDKKEREAFRLGLIFIIILVFVVPLLAYGGYLLESKEEKLRSKLCTGS